MSFWTTVRKKITSCYTLPRYYFNNLKCNEGVREFSMGASYTRDPHWIELLNSIKNMSTEIKISLPNICNHNYFHLTHCTAALHSYMLSQKDDSSEILTKLICLYFFRFWSSNQLVSMVQERNTFTSCLRQHLCRVFKERNLSYSAQHAKRNWRCHRKAYKSEVTYFVPNLLHSILPHLRFCSNIKFWLRVALYVERVSNTVYYVLRQKAQRASCLFCWNGLWAVLAMSTQISQEGIKCTKITDIKELTYCP